MKNNYVFTTDLQLEGFLIQNGTVVTAEKRQCNGGHFDYTIEIKQKLELENYANVKIVISDSIFEASTEMIVEKILKIDIYEHIIANRIHFFLEYVPFNVMPAKKYNLTITFDGKGTYILINNSSPYFCFLEFADHINKIINDNGKLPIELMKILKIEGDKKIEFLHYKIDNYFE